MELYGVDSEMNTFTNEAYTNSANLLLQNNNILSRLDNDTIFTVTFNLGKIVKAMFSFLVMYSDFTFQCFPEGIQIIEELSDINGRKEHISELIFDGKKQQEYVFIPENLPENFTIRDYLCIQLSVKHICDLMGNNKKDTSVKFLYSKSNLAVLKVFVFESDEKPIYSEVPIKRYAYQQKNFISDEIASDNITPILRLSTVDFIKFIERIDKKSYSSHDFEINLYTGGGISMRSLGPSGTSTEFGNKTGTEYKFIFPPKMSGNFKNLAKIACEKTSLFFYAFDNKILRISQWISSIAYQKFYFLQSDKMVAVYQQQQSLIHSQYYNSYHQQTPKSQQEATEKYYRDFERYQQELAEYNRRMLEYQQSTNHT